MACAPSTSLQLYLVSHRRQLQGEKAQCFFSQGDVPCVLQHVTGHRSDSGQPQAAGPSRLECPCSMTMLATSACPASTSALSPTCWGAPPSFPVSSDATITPRFHTASRTRRLASWKRLSRHAAGPGQQQQALRGEHLDVALRPGQPPGWCPLQRLKGSGASVSARAGPGQERRGSDAARLLP